MEKWKNIWHNPPDRDCLICLKIGNCCEVFNFHRISENVWHLSHSLSAVRSEKIPADAMYINLDNIE